MRAELQKLNSRLDAMNREELILSIQRLMEECAQKDAQLQVNSEAATEMSKQFHKLKDENTSLKKENKELLRQNRNLSDQLRMRSNDLFGRRSEKSSGLADAILDQAPEDPVDESSPEPDETQKPDTSERSDAYRKALHADGQGKRRGKKTPGKREKDLSRLPSHTLYDCDIDDLNCKYGEGNWRIAFWRREDTIESVHSTQYHLIRYRPVISSGLEHELTSPYPCTKLLPGSLASGSLVAELMYQKVVQCVPSYRMETDFIRSGIPLSRQTVTNWINRFCHELFAMVSEYMGTILITRDHNQCDETVYKVIRDGRKAGSTSFIWVHTSSELDPDHPVIVFRYELTRGTDHLRAFYGDTGYKGVITSDAYCSYDVLEKEYPDIHGSGCLMHARRKFYYAAMVIRDNGQPSEVLRELPEIKALNLIDAITAADLPLKSCSPDERLRIRQSVVKQKVNAYFNYLKTLDVNDPSYSEKLVDAIRYSLNQEEKLRRFLDDPMIPCDNGFAERSIRSFTTLRRNSLFSSSIYGAEALAILFTLSETAKANQAHPYYYLKYLLEKLPKQKVTRDKALLDDCMPWSEVYRAYEQKEKEKAMCFFKDQAMPEIPKTPRKNDRCA